MICSLIVLLQIKKHQPLSQRNNSTNQNLSIIGDIACDTVVSIINCFIRFCYNLVRASNRVSEKPILDVMAMITYLHFSLESSVDFASQLLPSLLS